MMKILSSFDPIPFFFHNETIFQPTTLQKTPICCTEAKSTGRHLQKSAQPWFTAFLYRLSVIRVIYLLTPCLGFPVCELSSSWQRYWRVFRCYYFTFKVTWVPNVDGAFRENSLLHLVITSEEQSPEQNTYNHSYRSVGFLQIPLVFLICTWATSCKTGNFCHLKDVFGHSLESWWA